MFSKVDAWEQLLQTACLPDEAADGPGKGLIHMSLFSKRSQRSISGHGNPYCCILPSQFCWTSSQRDLQGLMGLSTLGRQIGAKREQRNSWVLGLQWSWTKLCQAVLWSMTSSIVSWSSKFGNLMVLYLNVRIILLYLRIPYLNTVTQGEIFRNIDAFTWCWSIWTQHGPSIAEITLLRQHRNNKTTRN